MRLSAIPVSARKNLDNFGAEPHAVHFGPAQAGIAARNRERGGGNLKAILWTLVLAALVFVGIKVVPTLVSEYELQDGMQTIARFASVNAQTDDQIRQAVLKEAADDKLPVTAENIKILTNSGTVHIRVDFSVTVDLIVYQWTLNFHPEASNSALV